MQVRELIGLGSFLKTFIQEHNLPDKYPSLEDLKNSSFDWLTHRFANDFIHLKPKAEEVIAFVRSCYDVDNLLQA